MKIEIKLTLDLNNDEAVNMGGADAARLYYATQSTAINHLVAEIDGSITDHDETSREILDGNFKSIGMLTVTRTED